MTSVVVENASVFENTSEEIDSLINESTEEISKYNKQLFLNTVESIHRCKKRADTKLVYKRLESVGVTEYEFSKVLLELQGKKIIKIKHLDSNKESIRIIKNEGESKESQDEGPTVKEDEGPTVKEYFDSLSDSLSERIRDLEETVLRMNVEKNITMESLRTENSFLRNEITELTGLLDVLVKHISRQNHSTEEIKTNSVVDLINTSNVVLDDHATEVSEIIVDGDNTQESNFINENNMCYKNLINTSNVVLDNHVSEVSEITKDTEKSLNLNDQLSVVREEYKNKFYNSSSVKIKKKDSNKNSGKEDTNQEQKRLWEKNTILIAGDSILYGIDERRLSNKVKVKVHSFPGATISDMHFYLQPLLEKKPSIIVLHIGTNDAPYCTSQQILDKIIILKNFILEKCPTCKVVFSTPTIRTDDGKAMLTIIKIIELVKKFNIELIENSNINDTHLGRKGLHLNDRGNSRLAMNFINFIKNISSF